MADNVPITAGLGTTISTEEVSTLNGAVVSGQHVQRVAWARVTANGTAIDITASDSTVTSVAASTASQTLKAANANRAALIVVNDASASLYVKYGSGASTASYTYLLGTGDALREELWTGIVTGIWTSTGGAAVVTELRP